MPEVFERFFAEFGKKPADFFELVKLDPSYQVFFNAREAVSITPDIHTSCALFDTLEPGGGNKLRDYLARARYMHDVAVRDFLYRDYGSVFDFFNAKVLLEGFRLNIFQKLDAYVRKYFSSDRARKLLEYNIVFLGCSPDKSPAIYSILSHVDMALGVYYPMGGMCRLAEALESVARSCGAAVHYNQRVTRINVTGGRATQLQTDTDVFACDIALAACDYHHAETELLDPSWRTYTEKYWSRRIMAPSAFIACLGLNKKLDNLQHHNLFLSPGWQDHFASIFDTPSWPEAPSYYLACPSKTDSSVAPPGGETLFILVPVAPGLQDTDEIRERFFERVIAHLERLVGTPVAEAITCKKIISHRDFSEAFSLYKGTAMGMAHTLMQTALFRPARRSRKVANLYYTGHYTHPGIGLPMVLIAAHIIRDAIARDWS